MYLQRLSLVNFKNIPEAELDFSPRLNCLVGDNGAGKTNVLDAIHYLSLCKSAFQLTDGQSVRHGNEFFVVDGRFSLCGERRESISCSFKKGGGKVLKRNGKEYEKLSGHIGLIPVVLISPADTSLIQESGEDRRKYMNSLLSQIDREYLDTLIRYNKLLAERNRLLKQNHGVFDGMLDVFDERMAQLGKTIHARRCRLTDQLSRLVENYYEILSGGKETVEIAYHSSLNERDLRDLLREAAEKDRAMQHTTVGIHRDDLKIKISGYPLRKYGSQGQQKTFLVALKLAQFEIMAEHCGYRPILLLDDIFDKLDRERVERLIRLVSQERIGQIFITDSNKGRLELILENLREDHKLFTVSGGTVHLPGS